MDWWCVNDYWAKRIEIGWVLSGYPSEAMSWALRPSPWRKHSMLLTPVAPSTHWHWTHVWFEIVCTISKYKEAFWVSLVWMFVFVFFNDFFCRLLTQPHALYSIQALQMDRFIKGYCCWLSCEQIRCYSRRRRPWRHILDLNSLASWWHVCGDESSAATPSQRGRPASHGGSCSISGTGQRGAGCAHCVGHAIGGAIDSLVAAASNITPM